MRKIIIPLVCVLTLFYCAKNKVILKAADDELMKKDTAALEMLWKYHMQQFADDWSIRWNDTAKVYIGIQDWGDSTNPIEEGKYKFETYTLGTEYIGSPLGTKYDYICDDCFVSIEYSIIHSDTTNSIYNNKVDLRLMNIVKWKYIGQRVIIFAPSTFYPYSFFEHPEGIVFHKKRCITVTVMEVKPV